MRPPGESSRDQSGYLSRPRPWIAARSPALCAFAARQSHGRSRPHHDLDRLAVVHRPVAVGHAVEADGPVEDAPGLDPALEDVRQELLDVRAYRGGPAAHGDVTEERRQRGGHRLVLGDADAADRAARTRDADGRGHRLTVADALEDGVGAEAPGELAHALDGLLAPLAHHVRGAELPGQGDPVGVATEDDDLLGAEALGGDHRAQADGPVADDGHALPRADLRGDGRVVAGPHDVRERQQGGHQRVVLADRQYEERSVCLGDAHRFGLCSADVTRTEESSVDARRVKAVVAEDTGTVRVRERHDDEVAGFHGADVGADGLDDANGLVAHADAGLAVFQLVVRPEVAAADAGAGDADQRVGRLDEAGVGDVLDADVPGLEHYSCAHGAYLLFPVGCRLSRARDVDRSR